MTNDISLYSRYGDKYILKYIDDTHYMFPNVDYLRVGYADNEMQQIAFIDPPGGPMIDINFRFKDKFVVDITNTKEGFLITVE